MNTIFLLNVLQHFSTGVHDHVHGDHSCNLAQSSTGKWMIERVPGDVPLPSTPLFIYSTTGAPLQIPPNFMFRLFHTHMACKLKVSIL